MTAKFPSQIYTERETANLPGIVFDENDKKQMYSEDFQRHASEIIAIETILGENPQGAYDTVLAWLTALSAGGNFIDEETVSGSGTAFVLAETPLAGSVHLFALGQRLSVAKGDYTIAGKNITMGQAWSAGDIIADYRKAL